LPTESDENVVELWVGEIIAFGKWVQCPKPVIVCRIIDHTSAIVHLKARYHMPLTAGYGSLAFHDMMKGDY